MNEQVELVVARSSNNIDRDRALAALQEVQGAMFGMGATRVIGFHGEHAMSQFFREAEFLVERNNIDVYQWRGAVAYTYVSEDEIDGVYNIITLVGFTGACAQESANELYEVSEQWEKEDGDLNAPLQDDQFIQVVHGEIGCAVPDGSTSIIRLEGEDFHRVLNFCDVIDSRIGADERVLTFDNGELTFELSPSVEDYDNQVLIATMREENAAALMLWLSNEHERGVQKVSDVAWPFAVGDIPGESALSHIDVEEAVEEVFEASDTVSLIAVNIHDSDMVEVSEVLTKVTVDGEQMDVLTYKLLDERLTGLLPAKALITEDAQVVLMFYYNSELPPAARQLGKSQPNVAIVPQSPGQVMSYDKNARVFIDNAVCDGIVHNLIVYGDDQAELLFEGISDVL